MFKYYPEYSEEKNINDPFAETFKIAEKKFTVKREIELGIIQFIVKSDILFGGGTEISFADDKCSNEEIHKLFKYYIEKPMDDFICKEYIHELKEYIKTVEERPYDSLFMKIFEDMDDNKFELRYVTSIWYSFNNPVARLLGYDINLC